LTVGATGSEHHKVLSLPTVEFSMYRHSGSRIQLEENTHGSYGQRCPHPP
jgi:hypothetical protein